MSRYNANIKFKTRRSYDRLVLLAALTGCTMGQALKTMVAAVCRRHGIKIKVWGDK